MTHLLSNHLHFSWGRGRRGNTTPSAMLKLIGQVSKCPKIHYHQPSPAQPLTPMLKFPVPSSSQPGVILSPLETTDKVWRHFVLLQPESVLLASSGERLGCCSTSTMQGHTPPQQRLWPKMGTVLMLRKPAWAKGNYAHSGCISDANQLSPLPGDSGAQVTGQP